MDHANSAQAVQGRKLTAADWHMMFLRSWRFIIVIICFALTAPVEIISYQLGKTTLDAAAFLNEPIARAVADAEDARLAVQAAQDDPQIGSEYRISLFHQYQELNGYAQKLKLTRIANYLTGLALCISVVCSFLLVPFAALTPVNMKLATLATQGIFVLLHIKLYATYAQIVSLILGSSGIGQAMDLFGASIGISELGSASWLSFAALVGLVFYVLLLRNVAIIAKDIAKAMRTDEFPGAFGHTCGLTWQGVVMMSLPLLVLMVLLLAMLIVRLTMPGTVAAILESLALLIPAFRAGMRMLVIFLMWLALTAGKFAAIAWCYPHYIRLSQEMKGCAADALIENTPANATPVYYRRK